MAFEIIADWIRFVLFLFIVLRFFLPLLRWKYFCQPRKQGDLLPFDRDSSLKVRVREHDSSYWRKFRESYTELFRERKEKFFVRASKFIRCFRKNSLRVFDLVMKSFPTFLRKFHPTVYMYMNQLISLHDNKWLNDKLKQWFAAAHFHYQLIALQTYSIT